MVFSVLAVRSCLKFKQCLLKVGETTTSMVFFREWGSFFVFFVFNCFLGVVLDSSQRSLTFKQQVLKSGANERLHPSTLEDLLFRFCSKQYYCMFEKRSSHRVLRDRSPSRELFTWPRRVFMWSAHLATVYVHLAPVMLMWSACSTLCKMWPCTSSCEC